MLARKVKTVVGAERRHDVVTEVEVTHGRHKSRHVTKVAGFIKISAMVPTFPDPLLSDLDATTLL
jgi:hypothetical protein